MLLGLASDNGDEFLNSHLVQYCEQHRLTFTRSRPYWKHDQAHVKQKNWSIVRKVIGYDRYQGPEALAQLNRVYEALRLWTNHWQPVMKLIGKQRVGTKFRKRYDVARTPYQRLRESRDLTLPRRRRLEAEHANLAPLALKQQLDAAVMQLERLRARPAFSQPTAAAVYSSAAIHRPARIGVDMALCFRRAWTTPAAWPTCPSAHVLHQSGT